MIAKKFIVFVFILCCSVFAQDNNASTASTAIQALELQKQNNTWRNIKGNFANQNEFFNIAHQGFERYFRKYSPKVFSRNDESLIMAAKYDKYYVKCTFFIDSESQHIVIIESDSKGDRFGRRDPIRWIENVVKQVEKLGK